MVKVWTPIILITPVGLNITPVSLNNAPVSQVTVNVQ